MRLGFAAICAAGFCAALIAYFPGLLSNDSVGQFNDARRFTFYDWNYPLLPMIWSIVNLAIPGPAGMLLLFLVLYWAAFFILAEALATLDARAAFAMPLFGLSPFAINFVGTIWTDVLLAMSWLMATALVFSGRLRDARLSIPRQAAAWTFFLCGSWARPNALFAAVPLALYIAGPRFMGTATRWRRWTAIAGAAVLVPVALWLGSQLLFYKLVHVNKRYAIHSIVTFDLGGISHFSGRNYFPATWTDDEADRIIHRCYTTYSWNAYAWGDCGFVWQRLQDSGLWGSWRLWGAWFDAVTSEPGAYLRHRLSHFRFFMMRTNYVFHEGRDPDDARALERNPAFKIARDYVLQASRLGLHRPIVWLALAVSCLGLARRAASPCREFSTALSLSAVIYLLTYVFVGVAPDFRYAYWSVLASGTAAITLVCDWMARRSADMAAERHAVAHG